MEFRAQDHHHHNNNHHTHHNPHHHHDQIRSPTATSAPSFSPQPVLTPANSSPSDRRRSLSSNTNNNTSTMTSSQTQTQTQTPIPSQSKTPTNCTTQTLDQITPRPPPQKPSSAAVKYRECQKNHAASAGGSVYDGCGEFMPSGEEGSLEALKCAACSCHRNFHRKDLDGEGSNAGTLAIYSPGTRRSSSTANPLQITPPPQLHHLNHYPNPYSHHHGHHHHKFPIVQPMNVAYGGGGGGGTESSSEELNATADNSAPPPYSSSASAKKRFRTKFTAEQKERMLEFAERVGWRFQKQDEELVERFCSDVGIRRQVLKVWMHNNKSNNLKTKHQLDHVSILMGNMVGPTSVSTAVPVSASLPVVAPLSSAAAATDVVMNHVSDDDEEGLD